jgi:hypothetical protein
MPTRTGVEKRKSLSLNGVKIIGRKVKYWGFDVSSKYSRS